MTSACCWAESIRHTREMFWLLTLVVSPRRRVWTVSVVAARTPTWPTERRSWRPSPCRRKPWNRLASRWASTSPVSPRRRSVARPPAPPATPSSTSPRRQGPPSRPPSCRGRDTTTGALTIHWRCGLTAEVSPPLSCPWRYAHSPPLPPPLTPYTHSPLPPPRQAGCYPPGAWPGTCGGGARTRQLQWSGDFKRGSLGESPSVRRPKLHHACGLAYRCSERKAKKEEEM